MSKRGLHRVMLMVAIAAGVVAGAVPIASRQEPPVEAYAVVDEQLRPHAMALIEALRDGLRYVPGEVLVKFRAGTSPSDQASVLRLVPARPSPASVRWIGDLAVVPTAYDAPAEAVAARLAMEPEVEYAHPNWIAHTKTTPNDPGFTRQWNLQALNLPRAWDINAGAADVAVALVDTGVTTRETPIAFQLWTGMRFEIVSVPFQRNPDLPQPSAAVDLNPLRLTVVSGGQPLNPQPLLDLDGHGTHVSGTMAQATDNGMGLAGIAYRARLIAIKVCTTYWDLQFYRSAVGLPGFVNPFDNGDCETSAVVEGIRRAADLGAKVINVSLGGPDPAPAVLDALRYAVGRGAFVAIAMGNEFEERNPINYPAAYAAEIDGAAAVGATNRSGRRAFYSSTGSHTELAAPGGDSRDGGTSGLILQFGLFEADFDSFTVVRPRFDRYTEVPFQGTSMATPHVAGLAALLYSQGITAPGAIEAAMKKFAKDLGSAGRDNDFGFGLIDPPATLRGLGIAR